MAVSNFSKFHMARIISRRHQLCLIRKLNSLRAARDTLHLSNLPPIVDYGGAAKGTTFNGRLNKTICSTQSESIVGH